MLHTQVNRGSATASLDWSHDGIFDHEVAHLMLSFVKDQKQATIVGVVEKPRTKPPPIALNTVELLRVASSRLHIGPKQTMDMAERLYIEVSRDQLLTLNNRIRSQQNGSKHFYF